MMKTKRSSNREKVLHTATILFLTKGFSVTSMDEIVAASKVSKTNIYYYFTSKDDLLAAVTDEMIRQYDGLIATALSKMEISVLERMYLLQRILSQQETESLGGCPLLTLYTQASQESELIREKIRNFFLNLTVRIEVLLQEGVLCRELNGQLPVKQTAALVVAAIEGGLFLQHAKEDPSFLKHVFATLATMLK
jgi:TetR/AcrR family transcriptional repressor of nem operon